MRHLIGKTILLASLPLFASAQDLIPSGLLRLGDGSFHSEYAIVVDKSLRRTSIWKFDGQKKFEKVKEYISDHGSSEGNKLVTGDKKTPEGVYFFEEELSGAAIPYNKYGLKALTMNYPNLFDQRANKTGYGIWLHAIPDTESLERGSEGCVVVRNNSILEIANYVKMRNTPILVYGKANYISREELASKRTEIEELLRSWRLSWIQKNMDSYMSFYSDSFKTNGMNKARWERHKKGLSQTYDNIYVDFSDPMITEVDGELVIKSLQHYKSDLHEDFGEKTIYLQNENGTYKIIAEEWKAVEKETAHRSILAGTVLRDQRLSSNQSFVDSPQN